MYIVFIFNVGRCSVFAVCTPALSVDAKKKLTSLVQCYTAQWKPGKAVSPADQPLYTADMLTPGERTGTGTDQVSGSTAALRWQLAPGMRNTKMAAVN